MSSRRSRLKAVTNLPVRRKALTLQGNTNEATVTDNLTSEKVYSGDLKGNDISSADVVHENHVELNNANDTPKANSEPLLVLNSTIDSLQSENSVNETVLCKNNECNNAEVPEAINESRNLLTCRTDGSNGSEFKSSKRFKPNLVLSTIREKPLVQTPEKSKENESLGVGNCKSINNDNNITCNYNRNSNNNEIIKDGFKCYSVLTSDNVSLGPLSEYTISPCINAFNDTTISDVGAPQEYKEVQIYTEVESSELFINNEIGNCESIIESETLEPVLTNLTCKSNQGERRISYSNLNTSFVEVENPESLVEKTVTKNKTINNRVNFSGEDERYRNPAAQRQDVDISEYALSLNVCPNLHPFKKRRSTARSKRSKCNDYTKKLADAKKEFQKKYENSKPDRSTLKMIDLIFYNPGTNPMESKVKLEKMDAPGLTQISEDLQDSLAEEKIDEPESLDNSRSNVSDSGETENINKMPVPQVKIGLDGEIILDEKSLIIETTDAKKGREGLQNSTPIFEDREFKVSYYRGRCKKPRDWSDFETKRFYKALNTIGPDFTLMQKFFPTRSRLELKNKFKREERLNRNLIDKALNNPSEFDMTQLERDLAVEREAEEEIKMGRKKRRKKPRIKKSSFLSREMIDSEEESESDSGESKVNYSNPKRFSADEKNKKEKEFEFVFQKLLMKESQMSFSALPQIPSSPNAFEYSNQGVT